jgi:hypothetical protein
MAKIELLPRKAFEITLDDKTVIQGQFTSWSVKRFCDKKRYSLSQLFEQLSADKLSMDDTCQLILCAIEYSVRKDKKPFEYTDMDLCDWIDELGGWGSPDISALLAHAGSEETEVKEGEEKKSQQSSGQTSKKSATAAV